MAVQLTPPTKNVFYISVGLAVLSIVLYLLGVLGVMACLVGLAGNDCWSSVQGHLALSARPSLA
jgi:hypothetical protein